MCFLIAEKLINCPKLNKNSYIIFSLFEIANEYSRLGSIKGVDWDPKKSILTPLYLDSLRLGSYIGAKQE